ncbi:MAG: hypothetical protein M3460_02360 [Actinomycetota bacterium]|nr:hypothetical protein [Actinomycetota bacterium]
MTDEFTYPADHAIYRSGSPRVASRGIRYGHGLCTILWIRVKDSEWMLLPHGMPSLAIHITRDELTTMLDRLREKL